MLVCHTCAADLVINKNWSSYHKCRNQLICRSCNKIARRKLTPEQRAKYKSQYNNYYRKNKEKAKLYYESNKEACRERNKKARPKIILKNYELKVKVCTLLGDCKCCVCGETDIRLLQINHINGRNNETTKGAELYSAIVKGLRAAEDLDVRCANCNLLYEYERGNKQFPPEAEIHPGKKYEPFTFC